MMRIINGLIDGVMAGWMVLCSNLAVVAVMIVCAMILYILITSAPARLMVKALKNAIVKRFSEVPFVAKALYDENIRKCQSLLKEWEEDEKEEQARLASYQRELKENNSQIEDWEKKMRIALENGDEILAMEFAQNIVNTQKINERLTEDYIPSSKSAIDAIHKRQSEARVLIVKARNEKQEAIRNMKRGKLEEEHTDRMRDRSDVRELLKNFEEKSKEQRDRAIGARTAYENTIEHKEYLIEQGVAAQEARQLLEQCRKQQQRITEKR